MSYPGEVVSTDTILDQIWPALDAGDNPLHKVINQLRRALGDSAAQPEFIETIRRRGYRTVAPVQPLHQPRVQSHWQQGSPSQAYSHLVLSMLGFSLVAATH